MQTFLQGHNICIWPAHLWAPWGWLHSKPPHSAPQTSRFQKDVLINASKTHLLSVGLVALKAATRCTTAFSLSRCSCWTYAAVLLFRNSTCEHRADISASQALSRPCRLQLILYSLSIAFSLQRECAPGPRWWLLQCQFPDTEWEVEI